MRTNRLSHEGIFPPSLPNKFMSGGKGEGIRPFKRNGGYRIWIWTKRTRRSLQ